MKLTGSQATMLFAAGFGLYKAACGNGYLSAMGTAEGNVGFISTISFMITNNAWATLACLILLVSASRYVRIPHGPLSMVFYVLLAVDFAIVPMLGMPVLTGGMYGFLSACLSVTWLVLCLELFESPAITLTSGFLVSMVLQYILSAYVESDAAVALAMLAASALAFSLLHMHRRALEGPASQGAAPGSKPRRHRIDADVSKVFFPALLCLMVCVFVVGVSNTAIYGSSIESMFGGVDMQLVNLIAAIAAAVLVFCSARVPNPVRVYGAVLPVLFLVFSLIPIAGESLGPAAGAIMVGSYQIIALLFAAFSVEFVKSHRLNYCAMSAVCIGSSNLSLLLGLSCGLLLDTLSVAGGFPLSILVAFAAIYPLGLVLFFVTRRLTTATRTKREAFEEGPAPEIEVVDPMADVDAVIQQRAAQIAEECGLTEREREILTYVARGRSARVIAEELFITENTAWSHIKRIYAKTGVHSKQAILDMFQSPDRD